MSKVSNSNKMTKGVQGTDLESSMKSMSLSSAEIGTLTSKLQHDQKSIVAITQQLAQDASLTNKGDESKVETALATFQALATHNIMVAEPYLCLHMPAILAVAAHKQAKLRAMAEETMQVIVSKTSVNSIRSMLPHLFKASELGNAWQTRQLALKTIASFSDHAPMQLGVNLPEVIPQVTLSVAEPKREVKEAALLALTNSCDVVGNKDIEHLTSKIVRSITNPDEVPEIMHALAGVTFVQSVQSPALAMVVPLLIRGLRSRITATRRQSAVIIDNMSKLVDDPMDSSPFLPSLMPALEFAADAMSDPEARTVAENASAQLQRLNAACEHAKQHSKGIDTNHVMGLIQSKLSLSAQQIEDNQVVIKHVANLCCSLMQLKKFDSNDWLEVEQALLVISSTSNQAKECVTTLRPDCMELVKLVPMNDEGEDDDDEELCNCTFTLAYGTKILLHNTQMRLKRGHKYGLLGSNDSGKTTLMRSIANGSVEGFPDPALVRTVFVEADILGELSHLSCVDYILQDPRLAHCSRDEVLAVMATVGFRDDGKANRIMVCLLCLEDGE